MFGAGTSTPRKLIIDNPSLASEEEEELPAVVNLNVGGVHFTTRLSTLTKERGSNLAAMFSGRHVVDKDSSGRYFIDCNGGDFEYILNFLRSGQLPPETKAVDVYRLTKQFGISSLQRALEGYKPVNFFKNIDDIANGPKAREYQKIKESATEELKNLCTRYSEVVHTGNDIALHIISGVAKGQACDNGVWKTGIPTSLGIKNMYIMVDVEVTKELAWCLAEELRMMGYGQYIESFGHNCSCSFKCGESRERVIVLSSHQYEYKDNDWKRV